MEGVFWVLYWQENLFGTVQRRLVCLTLVLALLAGLTISRAEQGEILLSQVLVPCIIRCYAVALGVTGFSRVRLPKPQTRKNCSMMEPPEGCGGDARCFNWRAR